jgi:hypothetical protein
MITLLPQLYYYYYYCYYYHHHHHHLVVVVVARFLQAFRLKFCMGLALTSATFFYSCRFNNSYGIT